jgi:hypothetical protein
MSFLRGLALMVALLWMGIGLIMLSMPGHHRWWEIALALAIYVGPVVGVALFPDRPRRNSN